MKANTKTLLLIGGAAAVAYYLYTQSQASAANNALLAESQVGSDGQSSGNVAQDISSVLQDFGVGVG